MKSMLLWLSGLFFILCAILFQLETPGLAASIGFAATGVLLLPTRAIISESFVLTTPRTLFLILMSLVGAGFSIERRNEEISRTTGFATYHDMTRAKALGLDTPAALEEHDQKQRESVIAVEKAARAAAENASRKKDADCRTDLQCWGDKNSVSAAFACAPVVERLAMYSHEWTDGWTDVKFPRFRWKNKATGHITYIGDRIKFQNGFGAWQYHVYTCDFDPDTKTVLDAKASPGRLASD